MAIHVGFHLTNSIARYIYDIPSWLHLTNERVMSVHVWFHLNINMLHVRININNIEVNRLQYQDTFIMLH
jgi:hypothetical protein